MCFFFPPAIRWDLIYGPVCVCVCVCVVGGSYFRVLVQNPEMLMLQPFQEGIEATPEVISVLNEISQRMVRKKNKRKCVGGFFFWRGGAGYDNLNFNNNNNNNTKKKKRPSRSSMDGSRSSSMESDDGTMRVNKQFLQNLLNETQRAFIDVGKKPVYLDQKEEEERIEKYKIICARANVAHRLVFFFFLHE